MKALVWKDELGTEYETGEIPADMLAQAEEHRTKLIEACADYDDELMEAYLGEEEIPHERIAASLHRACLDTKVTPVLCGSSFKNKGVQPLLDAIVELLPSPLEVPPVTGLEPAGKGETEERRGGAARRRRRPLLGARLQGDDRPLRRQAHLLPRLLRQARRRGARAQRQNRQDRADRAAADDARQPAARRSRSATRATSAPASASSRRAPATRSPRPTRRSRWRRSTSPSR